MTTLWRIAEVIMVIARAVLLSFLAAVSLVLGYMARFVIAVFAVAAFLLMWIVSKIIGKQDDNART